MAVFLVHAYELQYRYLVVCQLQLPWITLLLSNSEPSTGLFSGNGAFQYVALQPDDGSDVYTYQRYLHH